jgi:chromosome segregation protein
MFLKSLELNGFKSFAQKTVLEFPKGITAIVGPNGSGKSNVIDAVRWLLGEREAKNLRGAKAEDLIFNGTPTRPRVSLASASLNFDNNSGFFPVDFNEVSVVRRVSRDGISQYFLNKAETKLKDIVDLFSRSRLGTKGLIIINQGEADLFVRASAEERKAMIEEILGLKEYQIKKSDAERKLKNTFLNLEKVGAMLEEAAPRVKTLKRQTAKWEKRAEIQKELEALENGYFSYKLNAIETAWKEIEPKFDFLEKQINEREKELKILEADLKKLEFSSSSKERPEIKEIKNLKQRLETERSLIQKESGRIEAKLEFFAASKGESEHRFDVEELLDFIRETKRILESGLERENSENFRKTIEGLLEKIAQFLERGENKRAEPEEFAELENSKKNLEEKLDALSKESAGLEEKEAKFTADLEEFNKSFQKAFELMEAKKEEIRKLESEKNKINFEKEKLNLKRQDLEGQLVQIGRTSEEFHPVRNEISNGIQFIEVQLPDIERRMFKLRAELSAIGEIDESLVREAEEAEAHYNFLTSQSLDLEKATVDLKNLIKELSEKIHFEFNNSLKSINEEFNKFFKIMFGGGNAKLKIQKSSRLQRDKSQNDNSKFKNNEIIEETEDKEQENQEEQEEKSGVEIDLSLPKKRITSLETLSGGEKSLVSIAALFALISISPPPFLVLDEIDAALDENNSRRFANLIKEFSKKTQFIVVTHNRAVMEAADVLYGVTVAEDGTSKILSLKLESGI